MFPLMTELTWTLGMSTPPVFTNVAKAIPRAAPLEFEPLAEYAPAVKMSPCKLACAVIDP